MQSQHPSQPPPAAGVRKARRALAEGPAVRAALAAPDHDTAAANAGWKLLDGPAGAARPAARDLTQPEASWRVVSKATDAQAAVVAKDAPAAKAPAAVDARPPAPRRAPTPAAGVARAEAKSLRRVTPPPAPVRANGPAPRAATPPAMPRVATPPAMPRIATPPAMPRVAMPPAGVQRSMSPSGGIPRPGATRGPTPPNLPAVQPAAAPVEVTLPEPAPLRAEALAPLRAEALAPPPAEALAPPAQAAAVIPAVISAVAPVVAEPPAPVTPAPVAAAIEESLPAIAAPPRAAPTPWLVASAAACLAIGFGLGLTLMQAVSPTPISAGKVTDAGRAGATKAEVTNGAAAVASASPVAEATPAAAATAPAPTTAPAPDPTAPAEPPASAPSSAIPWDDLPQATTKDCAELAPAAMGPKGFLLQAAVTNAQRALLKGDAAAAHASFCTAAQLGVSSDAVLLGLTQVLLMQADLTGALKTVDELLARTPANKQALEWRGDILIRMGRVDEAREAWFKAAGATRSSKLLINNLLRVSDADAKTALRSGDLSRADRMLRRSIALTSGDPPHCRELMAVLSKSGHTAAAARWRAYLSALGG